jgi:hypothetical protein
MLYLVTLTIGIVLGVFIGSGFRPWWEWWG